jgi:hypothetical protein
MARKPVSENSLIGKSRSEIIKMPGDKERPYGSSTEISYVLEEFYNGPNTAAVEYLKIIFNAENKVEKAEIEFAKTKDWHD